MPDTDLQQISHRSLWHDTSGEPDLRREAASGSIRADVIVVGAGYTGLSCALHLAMEHGRSVVLFEAESVGAGASGVNGGQVLPGLKRDPDELERLFADRGKAIVEAFGAGPDLVFSLIERHRIDCAPRRGGWVLAAHSPLAQPSVVKKYDQWRARGADVAMLSKSEVSELTGSSIYSGGLIDRRAGTIQPLAYARGLARAFVQAGGSLFERSRVTEIGRRNGQWRVGGAGFEATGKRVVIATDAYSGSLLPDLERSLLTVNSLQIATEPLPAPLDSIFNSGACLSETRKVAIYSRRDPDGRLLIGGRGPIGDNMPDRLFRDLQLRLQTIFPASAALRVTHKWHGRVGLTVDELPHLHEPEENLFIGVGYNGRGVAAATTMGKVIASRIAGHELGQLLPATGLSRIPWRIFRQPLLTAAVHYYRMQDRIGFGS